MLSDKQKAMVELWDAHVRYEFEDHDVDATLTTMSKEPHINNIPTMTGGRGVDGVHSFYTSSFVHSMPEDIGSTLLSRTVGEDQIVDETILRFTHTVQMPWILPGVQPTNKKVEVPLIAIIYFKDNKIDHEHIYWDQGTVLAQLGLIDAKNLPIKEAECAKKLENDCSDAL